MSVSQVVVAESRQQIGTTKSRRMRRQGQIPGNVYGLGQPNLSISMEADSITRVVASGIHVVDLKIGENTSKVIIREAQWNVFFTEVLHVDFQRVDPEARVDIEVDVVPRGVVGSGVLEQLVHKITLNCLAYQIPERIEVKVGLLKIGDSVHVSDLVVPNGAVCRLPADAVVLRIHEAKNVEIVHASAVGAEPEVIGKKKSEDGDAE